MKDIPVYPDTKQAPLFVAVCVVARETFQNQAKFAVSAFLASTFFRCLFKVQFPCFFQCTFSK